MEAMTSMENKETILNTKSRRNFELESVTAKFIGDV